MDPVAASLQRPTNIAQASNVAAQPSVADIGDDPTRPINSVQRALLGSEIKRKASPYYGSMRGQFANRHAMAQESAANMGLVEGTPEHAEYMARAMDPTLKQSVAPGSMEAENIQSRTNLAKERTTGEQQKNKYGDAMAEAKLDDIESRIQARAKNSKNMQVVHESLVKLRESQASINQARLHGEMPEQGIAAMEADRKQAKDQFLKQAFLALDKGDLAPGELQEIISKHLLEDAGITGAIAQPKTGVFNRIGKAAGLIDEPHVGFTPPTSDKAQRMLKSKQQGGHTDSYDTKQHETAGDSKAHLQALEKELGDLSKHEGKTYKDSETGKSFKIQGGHAVEVK